jgi:prostaglandin reductase 1
MFELNSFGCIQWLHHSHASPFVVGLVVESRCPSLPVGTRIVSYSGWVEKGRLPASRLLASPPANAGLPPIVKAPEILGLPTTLLLGACGMPGNTAYFGLLELCQYVEELG